MLKSRERLSRAVGFAVAAAACLFVIERMLSTGIWAVVEAKGESLLVAGVIGGVAYGLSCFLLAASWLRILRRWGQDGASARLCFAIYARTQLAKYIPGNVFHFIGRHALGHRLGFEHAPMVCAALLENVGLILAAALWALVGVLLWLDLPAAGLSPGTLAAVLAIPFLAVLALAYGLPRLAKFWGGEIRRRSPGEVLTGLVPAYFLYLAFFFVSGVILWAMAALVGGASAALLLPVAAAVAAAWIAGFLTPGASAGIGVREAVLVATLSPMLGAAEATLMAIAFRAVTLLGDVFFFASSFPMMRLPTTARGLDVRDRVLE